MLQRYVWFSIQCIWRATIITCRKHCDITLIHVILVKYWSIYHQRLIFGFPSWYPKFWSGKISACLNKSIFSLNSYFTIISDKFLVFPDFTIRHVVYNESRLKKCVFAMANLQNHKGVKIRKEDMIS